MTKGGTPGPARRRGSLLQVATGAGLLALVGLVVATGGVWRPASWSSPTMSASLFPMLALGGLAVCAILIAFGEHSGDAEQTDWPAALRMAATLGGIGVYGLLLPVLGWIPASVLLLVAMPLLLGYRQIFWLALFVTATAALAWLVFGLLVRIPLPAFP